MDLPPAFFLLHSNLPREGPGSDDSTRRAIGRLPALPLAPTILDMGCGPGKQTLVLAQEFACPIVAIDFHQPYLTQLMESARTRGLDHLIVPRCQSFEKLDDPPESVDLIWAEGSVYILGFSKGLAEWRRLLKPGGLAAVTEVTWLTDSPSAPAVEFWESEYPDITSIDENIRAAASVGFEVFDHFPLPPAAWWDEYYHPLEQRIQKLVSNKEQDEELTAIVEEHRREISMFRNHGHEYGYVFYLMRTR